MTSSGPYYQPLACPQCHQIDSVQKVSALVDAGTFSNLDANGFNNRVSHTQTLLSQRLSMPAQPMYESPWGPYLLLLIVGCGLLLCTGGFLFVNLPGSAGDDSWAKFVFIKGRVKPCALALGI